MRLSENCSLILDPPVDINGGAIESPFVDMAEGKDLAVKITTGAIAAGGEAAVTLVQDILGDGAGDKALAYTKHYAVTTASEGDVPAEVAGALTIGDTDDNKAFIIEVDASQLDQSLDYRFVKAAVADPGESCILGVELILTKKRDVTASAST